MKCNLGWNNELFVYFRRKNKIDIVKLSQLINIEITCKNPNNVIKENVTFTFERKLIN